MKIIYLVNARIPTEKAHGYQIMKMCEEFFLQKVDIELWVPTRANPIKYNAFEYYKLDESFKIKYLSSFDFLRFVKIFGRWSYYAQVLTFALKVLINKIPKDAIVYTRNPELAFILKLKGHKVVYECHDWFATKAKINLFLLKKCDKIVCTNNYIKQNFINNGFDEKKLLTAPNGVDISIFGIKDNKEEAVKKLKLEKEIEEKLLLSKVLLYTGSYKTMEVGKGIRETLEALKILDKENLFFVAVGGSEAHIKFYQDLAKELGVADSTLFLGRYEQRELALFQRASDMLMMPFPDKAHYKYHMTPLKMFEYLAGGRPIIASDLPSIREILDENTAVFCEPGNASDLALAIKNTIANHGLVEFICKNAKVEAEKYTWDERARRVREFLTIDS